MRSHLFYALKVNLAKQNSAVDVADTNHKKVFALFVIFGIQ